MSNTTEIKYIYQHNSPETAKVVEDYPWGFRLRTTIRYWIETKKAKNGGQRFAKQTINPKTGKWCAPKYSTYSPILIMYLDENDHVHCTALSHNSGEERILKFKETHLENLNEFQRETLKEIIAYMEVMKGVTFTIKAYHMGPVSLLSDDPKEVEKRRLLAIECDEREKRKQESLKQINRAIAHKINEITL